LSKFWRFTFSWRRGRWCCEKLERGRRRRSKRRVLLETGEEEKGVVRDWRRGGG